MEKPSLRLANIMQECVDKLQAASRQVNNSPARPPLPTALPSERKRERKLEDEEFLPNPKLYYKVMGGDKAGHSNGGFDMKMMLRKRLLKHRPKPPANAFITYVQSQKDRISAENPKKSIAEITSIASRQWRDLPPEIKQPYLDSYESRQKEYRLAQDKFILENPEFKTLSKSIKNREKKSLKAIDSIDDAIVDLDNVQEISSDSGSKGEDGSVDNSDDGSSSSQQMGSRASGEGRQQGKEMQGAYEQKVEEPYNSDSLIVDDEI